MLTQLNKVYAVGTQPDEQRLHTCNEGPRARDTEGSLVPRK
jgi:hypothetical protein